MADSTISVAITGHSERYRAALASAGRSTKEFRQEQEKATGTSRLLEYQTRQLNRALAQQSRQLGALTLQWVGFRRALFTAALRTAVTGLAALTSVLGSLAGGLVMVTHQLGLFGTALGVVGGAGLMALGQGAIVATLGLKGIGKALTTVGKEHENALKKLTPAARRWVGELAPVREAFREIKALAQEGLFDGLTRATKNLVPLLQPVKQAVYDTAKVLGYLAERTSEVMAGRKGDITSILQRNVVTLRRFGDAGINVFRALLDIFRAADPLIGHITRGIVTFTEGIADAARKARANGGLASYFYEVRKAWDVWTSTFGHAIKTIWNVMKAASGPAEVMARAINRTVARWEDWTGSDAGRSKLTKFFEASNKVLGAMAKAMGALVAAMADLTISGADSAVRFFDILRTKAIPTLHDLAVMMDKGLFQHLLNFMSAFLDVVRNALPGLKPFAEVLGAVAWALTKVTEGLANLVQRSPDWSKAITALTIGAGIIATWGKLRLAISLAILEMRRFLGLVPEMSGSAMSIGMRQLRERGGRPGDARQQGGAYPPVAFSPGGYGVGRGRAAMTRSAPWMDGVQPWGRLGEGASGRYPNWMRSIAADRAAGAGVVGVQPRTGMGPTGMQGPIWLNQARWVGQGRGIDGGPYNAGRRIQAPGTGRWRELGTGRFTGEPSTRTGPRTAAYESARNVQNLGRGLRVYEKPLAFMSGQALKVGNNLKTLAPEVGRTIAPFAKMGAGMAALSGVISAASGGGSLDDRMQNFGSGATFGLIPSAQQKQEGRAKEVQDWLQKTLRTGSWGGSNAKIDKDKFKGTQEQFRDLIKFVNSEHISDEAKNELRDYIKAWQTGATKIGGYTKSMSRYIEAGLNLGGTSAHVVTDLEQISNAFRDMGKAAGRHLSDIKETVKTNTATINGTLGKGTTAGRLALARNFRLAAAAVRQSMKDGEISTKTGTAQIRSYLISALQEVNPEWNRKQAGRYLHGKDPVSGKPMNSSGNEGGGGRTPAGQRGLLHSIPGKPGQDMPTPFLAAPGEDVAIFTRHQRKIVDQALAREGYPGLPGLFSKVRTEHNKPQAFARGGQLVTASYFGGPDDPSAYKKSTASGKIADEKLWGWAELSNPPGSLNFSALGGMPMGSVIQVLYNGKQVGVPKVDKGAGGAAIPPATVRAVDLTWAPAKALGMPGLANVHVKGGGTASKQIAAKDISIKNVTSGMKGLVGLLADSGLAAVRSGAQATVRRAQEEFPQFTAGTGGTELGPAGGPAGTAPFDGLPVAKWIIPILQWARSHGWAGRITSGYRSHAHNVAQGRNYYSNHEGVQYPSGAIDVGGWGAKGEGQALWNVLQNYPAPIKRRLVWAGPVIGDWGHFSATGHQRGGIIRALAGAHIAADTPSRNDGTPNVDTTPQSLSKGGSKGGSKSKKKPFAPRLGLPQKVRLRKKQRRAKAKLQRKVRNIRGWMEGGSNEDFINALTGAKGLAALNRKLGTQDTIFGARQADYDATAEIDSQGDGHVRDQKLNTLIGMLSGTDGQQLPDISEDLLASFAGPGVTAGGIGGTLLQILEGEAGAVFRLNRGRAPLLSMMASLRAVWEKRKDIYEHSQAAMAKLRKGHATPGDVIATNNESIKKYEAYLTTQQKRSADHRLTAADRQDMTEARKRIKEMKAQNTRLRKKNSKAAKTLGMTLEEKRTYWGLNADRSLAMRYMNLIGGDGNRTSLRGATSGLYADVRERYTMTNDAIQNEKDNYTQAWADYKSRRVNIQAMINERDEIPNVPEDSRGKEIEKLKDLATTLNTTLFDVFKGFAPLVGMRYVGAFAHGTGDRVVGETGMALVHADERIIPDPAGPFGTRAGQASGGDTSVQLVVNGELAPLIQLIDARIDGRAPGVVSRELGRRRRVFSTGPGSVS